MRSYQEFVWDTSPLSLKRFMAKYPPKTSTQQEIFNAIDDAAKMESEGALTWESRLSATLAIKPSPVKPNMVEYIPSLDYYHKSRWRELSLEKLWTTLSIGNHQRCTKEQFLALMETPQVKFIENTDPAGWIDIYRRGPQSCMKNRSCVQAYACPENDIRLAYIESKGEVLARTIVVEAKDQPKKYTRNYGNPILAHTLQSMGYVRDINATVGQVIWLNNHDLPYIDGNGTCHLVSGQPDKVRIQ